MKHVEQVKLAYAFGPFLFDSRRRELSRADRTLTLGSRAREILLLLLERAGETVSKRDLIRRVWSGSVVEEGTLRVHIATLRKTLGEGEEGAPRYLENVTGVGYRFIAPVTRMAPAADLAPAHPAPPTRTRVLGRDGVISTLVEGLPQKRLMTVVGPAGAGKTTVALAAAEQLHASYPDGVHHIDLQTILDSGLVCAAIASVLGLGAAGAEPEGALLAYGRSRRLLLVIDHCEHVIEAAAHWVDRLLTGAPGIHILATSREPLRVRSECILRLKPLELPEPGASLKACDALSFSAIQLLVERVRGSLPSFELSDADASTVAQLCQGLDGLPLAIELAAAQVDLYGVRGLAGRMEDCLALLTQGCRTAVPRHQSLRAALDWSYRILSPEEQQTLRRLAVLAGDFTASSAVAVAADAATQPGEVIGVLASLAAKSLLTVSTAADHVFYRLLKCSRAYALEKLESDPDSATIRRRHAQLCRVWAEEASEMATATPEQLQCRIEDMRAAIDWCFGPQGDPVLGLELAACSAPLWLRLSRLSEHRIRLERALMILPNAAPGNLPLELQLTAALGEALAYTQGVGQDVTAAYRKTLELAEKLGAVQDHGKALWGLYVDRITAADYEGALEMASRFQQIPAAPDDRSRELTVERMQAVSLYMAGNPAVAYRHAERLLRRVKRSPVLGVAGERPPWSLDHRIAMSGLMPAILWLLGLPQQAKEAADAAIRRAVAAKHAPSLCYTVTLACPVLVWVGEMARARTLVEMLIEQGARHCLGYWSCWGACLQLATGSAANEAASCVALANDPLCAPLHLDVLATLRPDLASAEVLGRAERGVAGWCMPELLRVQAERMPRHTAAGAQKAEAALLRALVAARSQGALSWELRAAISLGRLRRDGGRRQEAHALLESVLRRFKEGFDTPDLVAAQALARELAGGSP